MRGDGGSIAANLRPFHVVCIERHSSTSKLGKASPMIEHGCKEQWVTSAPGPDERQSHTNHTNHKNHKNKSHSTSNSNNNEALDVQSRHSDASWRRVRAGVGPASLPQPVTSRVYFCFLRSAPVHAHHYHGHGPVCFDAQLIRNPKSCQLHLALKAEVGGGCSRILAAVTWQNRRRRSPLETCPRFRSSTTDRSRNAGSRA